MSRVEPPCASAEQLLAMRSALESAGFSEPRLCELLNVAEIPSSRDRDATMPELLRRTRGGSALETLARLFLLHREVTESIVREALATVPLETWIEAGILALRAGSVRSLVELSPYRNLLVASDWPAPEIEPVMGIASTTRALDLVTIRRPFARVLDLGAGSGIQAMLAARHAERVWAVDLNPRASAMTRFNAGLNGVEGIDCRTGSLFEPVGDQRFDLIVCNPPFLIGPEPGPMHSRNDRPGDAFCRDLVRQAATHLNEGGFCQVLCNWTCPAGEGPDARLASWFEGLGCDVLALRVRVEDAASYAMARARDERNDLDTIASRFDRIIRNLDKQNIHAIGYGAITMQRASSMPNWFRSEAMPALRGPCGEAIARRFRHAAFLRDHADDARLIAARVRAVHGLRWETAHDWTPQGWVLASSRLTGGDALAISGNADRSLTQFLGSCNGDRTLQDHVLQIARESGRDPAQLVPDFLRVVRRLIAVGNLEPIDPDA